MDISCPLIDQRTQPGVDGRAPEDGNMDCVPASLASMASALLGTPQNADAYHDAVYGQGYVGMQDPAAYVSYLAAKGLTLQCFTGAPADLVNHALWCIRAHTPVLLSIPSDWDANPPTSANAHMVAGCDVDSSAGTDWDHLTMTAMNPWGTAADGYSHAAYQTETMNWWLERLTACRYKATWVMSPTKASNNVGVPSGWHDDGTTLTAPNGVPTAGAIRAYVIGRQPQWPAELQPVAPLYGTAAGWQQEFAASVSLVCDQGNHDAVSEQAGPDYVAELNAAKAQIAQLQAQVKTLENTVPAPADPAAEAALTALISLKSTLAEIPG